MAADERIDIHGTQNTLADQMRQNKGMRREARVVFVLGVVFVLTTFITMVLPTFMFQHSLIAFTPAVFLDELFANIAGVVGVFTGNGESYETHFMQVIICAVSGAALGLCGSTYQGAFNNPLAAPKTLGVMSGGALGALVYLLFFKQFVPTMPWTNGITTEQIRQWEASLSPLDWFFSNYGQCLCSIVGCFVIVAVVMLITSFVGRGRISNISVIIAGQIFSVAITAIIQFARYYFTTSGGDDMAQQLAQIENYTMVNTYYFQDLLVVVAPIVVCIVVVLALRGRLTLLSFGDEEAYSMGVNVNRTRYIMIALCTLMTALAISFCGHVAYLGFISAHIARKLTGPDFRYLLPASVCVGGTLLCVIQWLCNSGLPFTSSYAAGPVCSILGASIFLVLALRQGRRGDSDWG